MIQSLKQASEARGNDYVDYPNGHAYEVVNTYYGLLALILDEAEAKQHSFEMAWEFKTWTGWDPSKQGIVVRFAVRAWSDVNLLREWVDRLEADLGLDPKVDVHYRAYSKEWTVSLCVYGLLVHPKRYALYQEQQEDEVEPA